MEIYKASQKAIDDGRYYPMIYFKDWKVRIFYSVSLNSVKRFSEPINYDTIDLEQFFRIHNIPKDHWCLQKLTVKEIAKLKIEGVIE